MMEVDLEMVASSVSRQLVARIRFLKLLFGSIYQMGLHSTPVNQLSFFPGKPLRETINSVFYRFGNLFFLP